MMRRLAISICVLGLLVGATPVRAASGTGSPNMSHVTTLSYARQYGQELPFGTDIEFARIGSREYAFAGTYRNGLQIIDITNPRRPRPTAVYDCALAQGDVQVFRRGSKTMVAYAGDDYSGETFTESDCYSDVGVIEKSYGTFIIDVSKPAYPKTVGFVNIPFGSHNQTVHPSGRYLYNSNADLALGGAVEIFDITTPSRARSIGSLPLITGLESHDITFNSSGNRAYVAALTHTLIVDTTNPREPEVIGRILDPAINIHHQSDPITIDDPVLGKRTFLVVTDELAGAAGNGFCPGGGLHIYDITGPLEATPLKVGFWAMPEVRPATDNLICTSHVLRFYPKQKLMTIAWYGAGVRVVDVSSLVGVSLGVTPDVGNVGMGMREIGYYTMPNADTWSAKTNKIEKNGSFYLFGNDMNRGLDVYRFDARKPKSGVSGTWLTPAQAMLEAKNRGIAAVGPTNAPVCILFGKGLLAVS
jgi:hypothetical protein